MIADNRPLISNGTIRNELSTGTLRFQGNHSLTSYNYDGLRLSFKNKLEQNQLFAVNG